MTGLRNALSMFVGTMCAVLAIATVPPEGNAQQLPFPIPQLPFNVLPQNGMTQCVQLVEKLHGMKLDNAMKLIGPAWDAYGCARWFGELRKHL